MTRFGPTAARIGLIGLYKRFVSPLLPAACRFTPTCSEYFAEALRTRGIILGFVLGCWRILRCNPLSRGGWDPVDGRPLEPSSPEPDPQESEFSPGARNASRARSDS